MIALSIPVAADPLLSARLKIERAEAHIRDLNEHIRRHRETNPYEVTRELERDGAEHVYRVRVLSQPPLYLGTVVGDFFHNLRSALDSIVYDLSRPAIPTLSVGEVRSIGFPIAVEKEKYNRRAVSFASRAAQAEIKRSQPYNGAVPILEPLWVVSEFNRIDKHRFVQVIPALSMGSIWKDPGLPYEESHHPLGPFEDGAELARFTFAEPEPNVDMQFTPMFDVALPGRNMPAGIDMRDIANHIRDVVLPRFARFL